MTRITLLIAATLTLGAILRVMLPEIGKKTDFMKAPPLELVSLHQRKVAAVSSEHP